MRLLSKIKTIMGAEGKRDEVLEKPDPLKRKPCAIRIKNTKALD